jgi:hypothetical protein
MRGVVRAPVRESMCPSTDSSRTRKLAGFVMAYSMHEEVTSRGRPTLVIELVSWFIALDFRFN